MTDTNIAPDQVVLSEMKDGRMIGLTTTTTPGQLLHQGAESSSGEVWDVVTIEAVNNAAGTQTLTIAWGGTDTADLHSHDLESHKGRVPTIIKGRLKRGLPVRGWATASGVINIYGEVGVLEATETV